MSERGRTRATMNEQDGPTHEQIDASRMADGLPPIYGTPDTRPARLREIERQFSILEEALGHMSVSSLPESGR